MTDDTTISPGRYYFCQYNSVVLFHRNENCPDIADLDVSTLQIASIDQELHVGETGLCFCSKCVPNGRDRN